MVGTWLKRGLVLSAAVFACGSTGCSTMSNTEKGVGIGGALGAGAGTLIGAATGNPKTGAVVGGLLGAGTGGLIGADVDAQEKKREQDIRWAQAEAAQQNVRQMTLDDVIAMSKPGANGQPASDSLIISSIQSSHSRFDLSPGDINYLRANGVSDRVVEEMVRSRDRRVAITGPPPSPPTVVVREPSPVVVYERPYWGYRPVYMMPPPPRPGVYIGGYFR